MKRLILILIFLLIPSLALANPYIWGYVKNESSDSSDWPSDPSNAEYIYVDTDGSSGDYSSLSAAEAAIGTTGYCANVGTYPCVIVCSATTGVADTTAVTFDFSPGPTSAAPLIVRTKSPDDSYEISLSSGINIDVKENYITFRGLELSNSGTTDNVINTFSYSSYVTIDACCIHGGRNGIYRDSSGDDNSGDKFTNNFIYGCYESGINLYRKHDYTYKISVINNTIYNCNSSNNGYRGGLSANIFSTNFEVYNNISVGNGNKDFYTNDSMQSYNISSDTSASGTGSLTNKSLSDIDFVSTTSGSEDLHIQSTSDAVGAGTDPTAIITHDIDGDTRGSTNVEIGADEL